jgi:hypothetical protein
MLPKHFLLSDDFSDDQYDSFGWLVYLVRLLGGAMADRFMGSPQSGRFWRAASYGASVDTALLCRIHKWLCNTGLCAAGLCNKMCLCRRSLQR